MKAPYEFQVVQRPSENLPVLVLKYTDAQQCGHTVEIPLRAGIPMMIDALSHLAKSEHAQLLKGDRAGLAELLAHLQKLSDS